jgi:hypothetical protein
LGVASRRVVEWMSREDEMIPCVADFRKLAIFVGTSSLYVIYGAGQLYI